MKTFYIVTTVILWVLNIMQIVLIVLNARLQMRMNRLNKELDHAREAYKNAARNCDLAASNYAEAVKHLTEKEAAV